MAYSTKDVQGASEMQEENDANISDEHDTIFDEESLSEIQEEAAQIDFELLETQGKWLVKVVSGPNSGAEFSLSADGNYLIGTDATTCDIVFNDLSVSRQHARVMIDSDEHVAVEDLGSKNGTFVDNEKITERRALSSNALISMGTTTFMLIDREGERHTIVSMPQIPQAKKEETKPFSSLSQAETENQSAGSMKHIQDAVLAPIQSEIERIKEEEKKEARHAHAVSSFIVLAVITGLFVIAGIGTTMLFKTQTIPHEKEADPDIVIAQALKDYPSIRYSFNPSTGKLLLIGHLLTAVDRSKMLDNLQQLPIVTSVESSNVIIDEYVWREINQVLAENPAWKSITVSSPGPGKFVMTGFLKTRKQADLLSDYITQNFSYPDLLDKRVVVEEDLKAQIQQKLNEAGFKNLTTTLDAGELALKGTVGSGDSKKLASLVDELKQTPGIRNVQLFVTEVASEQGRINISERYQVTGYSAQGRNFSVVINGKILTKGDAIDGMLITDIQPTTILLEKDGFKYRIDFNR